MLSIAMNSVPEDANAPLAEKVTVSTEAPLVTAMTPKKGSLAATVKSAELPAES